MFVSATVTVNLKGLVKLQQEITQQLNGASGPVNDALSLWAVRYRSWAQQRFDLYSKGGGDWQRLAPSTIKQRRQGTKSNVLKLRQIQQFVKKDAKSVSGGGNYSILRDTGLLFNALSPIFVGSPGAVQKQIKFGIRVGYGGPQKHAVGSKHGKATIADIASFHQNGNLPRLPKREIIADPPEMLLDVMASDMQHALDRLSK